VLSAAELTAFLKALPLPELGRLPARFPVMVTDVGTDVIDIWLPTHHSVSYEGGLAHGPWVSGAPAALRTIYDSLRAFQREGWTWWLPERIRVGIVPELAWSVCDHLRIVALPEGWPPPPSSPSEEVEGYEFQRPGAEADLARRLAEATRACVALRAHGWLGIARVRPVLPGEELWDNRPVYVP
jgi:hypothetical protein